MKLVKRLLSLIPTKLPVGVTEFETWANSIIELSGKFANEDSMKFVLATQIMHLGPQRSSVPKNFFVQSLRKTAANQIASQVFQDIKNRQLEEAAKAAEAAKQVAEQTTEDTTTQKLTQDGQEA